MDPGEQRANRPRLRVVVSDADGRAVAPGVGRWLSRVAPSRVRGTVNVAVISDRRVRALNRQYRGIDHPTDVLSFPVSNPPPTTRSARRSPVSTTFLGDVVIAQGIARRQARAMAHSETTELKVLALHGLLHLLGYDHEHDNGAMARLERRLRRKGGLREGLIERR